MKSLLTWQYTQLQNLHASSRLLSIVSKCDRSENEPDATIINTTKCLVVFTYETFFSGKQKGAHAFNGTRLIQISLAKHADDHAKSARSVTLCNV